MARGSATGEQPLIQAPPHDQQAASRRRYVLGAMLAFVAGAADVCGFLRLGAYTSHITGATTAMARGLEGLHSILTPAVIVLGFLAGATLSSMLLQWLQRRGWWSEFIGPTLLEAALLAGLALFGSPAHRTLSLGLLAFTMGLQNATITRLSDKEVRTTHLTAMLTDVGIQFGRALYPSRNPEHPCTPCDRRHLYALLVLIVSFFVGAVLSAFATPRLGLRLLLVLAGVLVFISAEAILAEFRRPQTL